MCRLYGFRANEPTKVECTLVHAQNALMVQSRADLQGFSHAQGWGIATYEDHLPHVERQAWAAYHGEHFRRAAERIHAYTVLAHVRRATVGPPVIENTHPFVDGAWALIHNGTVPRFAAMRPRLLEAMTADQRARIRGHTDSEHVFRLLRSLMQRAPHRPLADIMRQGAELIVSWCQSRDPRARIGLNLMLSDGASLVGTRLGRTLYYVIRDGVHDCEICGFPHIEHDPRRRYRAVVIASEPISHETWTALPERSLYQVTGGFDLDIKPL